MRQGPVAAAAPHAGSLRTPNTLLRYQYGNELKNPERKRCHPKKSKVLIRGSKKAKQAMLRPRAFCCMSLRKSAEDADQANNSTKLTKGTLRTMSKSNLASQTAFSPSVSRAHTHTRIHKNSSQELPSAEWGSDFGKRKHSKFLLLFCNQTDSLAPELSWQGRAPVLWVAICSGVPPADPSCSSSDSACVGKTGLLQGIRSFPFVFVNHPHASCASVFFWHECFFSVMLGSTWRIPDNSSTPQNKVLFQEESLLIPKTWHGVASSPPLQVHSKRIWATPTSSHAKTLIWLAEPACCETPAGETGAAARGPCGQGPGPACAKISRKAGVKAAEKSQSATMSSKPCDVKRRQHSLY